MRKSIFLIVALVALSPVAKASSIEDYHQALKTAVVGNRVNYQQLCQDKGFGAFISAIADGSYTKPMDPPSQLAFWLNIYNAYNAKIVCDNYPISNLNQLHKGGLVLAALRGKTVWDKPIIVSGKMMSLKFIEHQIIKKDFQQPLSQFGLACGSIFCPSLREEPYEGKIVNEQLANQAKRFFADQSLNRFDRLSKTAYISPIMNWNAKYFGQTPQKVLVFIASYLSDALKADITTYSDQWQVKYSRYDLIVNDSALGGKR